MFIESEKGREVFDKALEFYKRVPAKDVQSSITESIIRTITTGYERDVAPESIRRGIELLVRIAAYFYIKEFVEDRQSASSWYNSQAASFFGSGSVN